MRHRPWDEQAAFTLLMGVLVALVVGGLLAAYLTVQGVRIVQSACVQAPKTRLLWVAAAAVVASATLVLATGAGFISLTALAVSVLTLVALSRLVQLRHDPLLQRPVSFKTVLSDAPHGPW